jgi:hypothetical protein
MLRSAYPRPAPVLLWEGRGSYRNLLSIISRSHATSGVTRHHEALRRPFCTTLRTNGCHHALHASQTPSCTRSLPPACTRPIASHPHLPREPTTYTDPKPLSTTSVTGSHSTCHVRSSHLASPSPTNHSSPLLSSYLYYCLPCSTLECYYRSFGDTLCTFART